MIKFVDDIGNLTEYPGSLPFSEPQLIFDSRIEVLKKFYAFQLLVQDVHVFRVLEEFNNIHNTWTFTMSISYLNLVLFPFL